MSQIIIDSQMIKQYCNQVFISAGLSTKHATIVSDNLIEAELRGIYSHGISKVKPYVRYIQEGVYNKKPHINILKESPSTLLIDGDFSMGAISGTKAMQLCIKKAKKTGFACSVVRRGTHFGIASYYAMQALDEGMIGIASCNSGKIMSVYGGTSRVLGTNPICVAVPSDKRYPIVFDAATSEAAFNKIIVASIENRSIPPNWALNEKGESTTDANQALKGMVVPFGGYKGSGLAVIVQVLSGVLSGLLNNGYYQDGQELGQKAHEVGFFFAAIDIKRFLEVDHFKKDIDALIEELKSSRLRDGTKEIYLPGELEFLQKEHHLANGIVIGKGVYKDLIKTGLALGINFNLENCILRKDGE